jgi:SAM-dependent methyltransferase
MGVAAPHESVPPPRDALLRALPGATRSAGALHWRGRAVPVRGGIARFRADDGYNAAFAQQWKAFAREQIDAANGTGLTRERVLRETRWDLDSMAGELVLEAGCGAGRFTEILAATGCDLVSLDYSSAVEVAADNNARFPNVAFAQADILDLPFPDAVFDRVFCHGVLQHTPDPAAAFRALDRVLKPGGRMSFDVYLKDGTVQVWKRSISGARSRRAWSGTASSPSSSGSSRNGCRSTPRSSGSRYSGAISAPSCPA